MSKIQSYINYIADPRARRSIRSLFTKFLNDDDPTTFKGITFGAATTPISIAGTFTTGISISADGTTAISITSGFSGTTMLSLAGTGTDGMLVSGVCADGVHVSSACTSNAVNISGAEAVGLSINTSTPTNGIEISAACSNAIVISGANTTAGLSISGNQVLGTLFHATAAATAAHSVTIPTGITLDAGFDINVTSTGVVTSGLTLQGTGEITTGITLSASTLTTGVNVGTAATGITFTGGYTTAAIQLGTSGSTMTLAVHDDHVIDIDCTCASTDTGNSVRPIHMTSHMTGAGGVGGRAEFVLSAEAALGGWANALKGSATFNASGSVTGLGSCVCADLTVSAGTTTGTYTCFEGNIIAEASASTGTATSFFHLNADGALEDTLDGAVYLFVFGDALDAASGKFIDTDKTAQAAYGGIRVNVEGVGTKYIRLYDAA